MTSDTCSRNAASVGKSPIERTNSFRFSSRPAASARALGLPHVDQAALLEDVCASSSCGATSTCADQRSKSRSRSRRIWRGRALSSSLSISTRAARISETPARRTIGVQHAQRRFAQAAPRQIVDALESEIVVGLGDATQIGQRVADFRPLVESRAADHLVGQAERDETLLELAHLERGAHQNGDFVERNAGALRRFDLLADDARLLLRCPTRR